VGIVGEQPRRGLHDALAVALGVGAAESVLLGHVMRERIR
jgi:hypothetical protein